MDLLSSRPFWPLRDGLPTTFPPLDAGVECDVAIIGGGISGAMIAWYLTEAGLDVIVLDGREAAHGSTAGNTGLLLYELDEMLHRLVRRFGRAPAERAYRRCRVAIPAVERLVRCARCDCGFARRSSLYLAADATHVSRLAREFAARQAAGLDVTWWPRRRIRAETTLPHPAAILSSGAAQLDAYLLTYGLLMAAHEHGAKIHDRTHVTRCRSRRGGVDLVMARGHHVRARQLVVAAGYEAGAFLPESVGALHSTYAVISEPVPAGEFPGWPANRALIWDTGDPYLYLRTTSDDRAIIGGYDEPFSNAAARDELLPRKSAALQRRFRRLFPRIPFELATAWAGTFGITADGLPIIGQHPKVPDTWFALGFGGNGTTFSLIAAEIIRNTLVGDGDPDADLFGFERLE